MERAKVKLGLAGKSVATKLQDANRIIDQMGSSPVYGGAVDLTDFIAKRDALQAAETAQEAAQLEAQSRTQALRTAEQEYKDSIRSLAVEAETVGNYSAEALNGGGWEFYFPGIVSPVTSISTPVILEASPGGSSGKINLRWTPIAEASKGYNVYVSTNPNQEDNFPFVKSVSKSSTVLTGLNTGTKYWIQVVAFGAIAQSEPSDPASSVAR